MLATDRVLERGEIAALLARGGVQADAASIRPHPKSGRNRLVAATGADGRRWVVKQTTADGGLSPREAWFYRNAASRFGAAPACLVTDAASGTVVLEEVTGGRTLLAVATESPADAVAALPRLARPLARLHVLDDGDEPAPRTAAAMPELDPVPLEHWFLLPLPAQVAVEVFQSRDALTRAYAQVRACEGPLGIVHGDLKLDNVIACEDRLVVLDWELCGVGPLAWDVGSVVGSALVLWSDGLRAGPDTGADEWVRDGAVPFDAVAAAVRRFLEGYLDALPSHATPPTPAAVASHTSAWIAARVWADACLSVGFSGRHHLRLLVAENLLRTPQELFGDLRW